MGKQYESIKTLTLPPKISLAYPPALPEVIHLDDPVLTVFIDFHQQRPITIAGNQSIDEAQLEMKSSNVHMLLVVDHDHHVIGILSSKALHGELPYKIIKENRIKHSDIPVSSIMLPIDQVLCLDYDALATSKIINLVETFKLHHRHYALVIKKEADGGSCIQGYFSASRISRTLSLTHFNSNTLDEPMIQELQALLREFI